MAEDPAGPVIGDEAQYETSKGVKPLVKFEDMGLKPLLLKGIYQFGFEKPSAIQQRAIVPITEGEFHCRVASGVSYRLDMHSSDNTAVQHVSCLCWRWAFLVFVFLHWQ